MKARQMGGACAVAIVLLTAGAITGSAAAMADDRLDRQPENKVMVCSTGPVYRSSHVRVDIKCDIKVDVDDERRRHKHDHADFVGDTFQPESW